MALKLLIYLNILLTAALFFQCQAAQSDTSTAALEKNLRRAGRNRKELEKVLQYYQGRPEDSLKFQAAIILLSNIDQNLYYKGEALDKYNAIFEQTATRSEQEIMVLKDSLIAIVGSPEALEIKAQQDLQTLSSDYLIQNIEEAFAAWQETPWRDSVSFNSFCNYILPYHNFNEKPENWRRLLKNRYQYLLKHKDKDLTPAFVSCDINDDLKSWFRYSEQFDDYPGRLSISQLLKGQRGNCSDMSNLAAYSARALGIPVAIDYTPQWGNYHDGHVWNAVILNEQESLSFLGAEANPGEYTGLPEGESKIAKVFRRTLVVQENSVAARAAHVGEIKLPTYIQNARLQDVTPIYTKTYTVTIPVKNRKKKFVYLCIAKQNMWEAIEGSAINAQGNATFSNVGHNILYNPMFYDNGNYTSAGMPFILTYEGQLKMLPADQSATETVQLTRIFPFKRSDAKWKFAEYYKNARLEGANQPDFSDAQTLFTITNPLEKWHIGQVGGPTQRDRLEYENLWEKGVVTNSKPHRYVRLIFAEKQFCKVGELEILGADDKPLTGKAIGSVQHPAWAFDGVPGYSIIDESAQGGHWVGLDLGKAQIINALRYLPATGEHAIRPGKTYQLFYWDDHWKSLGIQKANQHLMTFDKVPSQALLWLHCKDCNNAFERPFTYENGKQIWW